MLASLIALSVVFGAAAAAFVPRPAYRLAVEPGAPSRSSCEICSRPFPSGIPGWIRAGQACRCIRRMPWVVPAGGAAAGLIGWSCSLLTPVLLPAVVLGVLLAAVDLRCLRLPDPLVAALALLLCPPLAVAALIAGEPGRLGRSALAGAMVGAAYLALALAGGLGLGDVKLAAVLGFLLGFAGWPAVLIGLVVPQLINGPIALVMLLQGRIRRSGALPFGPALLLGALAALAFTA